MVTSILAADEAPLEKSSNESGIGRSDSPSDDSEPEANIIVPPDGGWGWVVVVASFLCNLIVDGIIFSGGSVLPFIREEFHLSESQVAPVNSLMAGFYLLAGPFVSALANKYGFRIVTIIGAIVSSAAIALSYYANSVTYLYFVYGIIGGIGFCMVYMPAVLIVGFYFERWRAMATGLALCGSGVGTFMFAPLTTILIEKYQWRTTLLFHAAIVLLCIICGATFRPIKPVHVVVADESEECTKKQGKAVEKFNSNLKIDNNLDAGKISMPAELRSSNSSSPHTWMGVAKNTQYPTAEEVFRASSSHLHRRSSANAGAIKNAVNGKPLFIAVPVVEKDEQEDSNSNNDNTEPLISSTIKVVPNEPKPRHSNAELSRPLYRDDIFFGASLTRLPQYTSRSSLAYHLAVTHVPTKEEAQEERTGKCQLCPEAVKRTLATMLDVSLLKSPTVLILALSGFFTMLGYLVPFMYIEERAKYNKMEKGSSMLVSTIGIVNIIGRITCGLVSSMPKVSPLWLNNITLTLGGIATMLSGLYYNPIYQYAYCAVFAIAIACFASLRSILVVEYLGLEQLTSCFGLFLLLQGLGALLGSPIAGAIKDLSNGSYDASFYVAGSFILFSALLCYPIDYVSRWEKARKKLSNTPNV